MKLTSITLLFLYSLYVMRSVIVMVDFDLNKEFIVNNVCVQKANKENTCQGHCALMQKLKSVDQNESNDSSSKTKISIQEDLHLGNDFLEVVSEFEINESEKSGFDFYLAGLITTFGMVDQPPKI